MRDWKTSHIIHIDNAKRANESENIFVQRLSLSRLAKLSTKSKVDELWILFFVYSSTIGCNNLANCEELSMLIPSSIHFRTIERKIKALDCLVEPSNSPQYKTKTLIKRNINRKIRMTWHSNISFCKFESFWSTIFNKVLHLGCPFDRFESSTLCLN